MTADAGKWTGTQPITFAGEWLRCDSGGGNCVVASGGPLAGQQFTLTSADVGHRMRVRITATNSSGKAVATSNATSVVSAAPAAAPRNTAAPTISGTAQDGQTLSGDKGQWDGTQPIDFNVYWQRCDKNGNSCADISRANAGQYVLTSADVGNRVRFRVRAQNKAGTTNAYAASSGVVVAKGPNLPPGAIKLPDGKISIPVTSVVPPDRLNIAQFDFSPNPLRSRDSQITARFRVYENAGYVVRDALVFVTPLPYGWVTQPAEVATGTDGWAGVQMHANPQLPKKSAIVMFVRARKAGDPVLTGVSNRRLVQMLVSIP